MSLLRLVHAVVFYASLLLFGAWAFAFNLLSFLGGWLPRSAGVEAFFQRLIRRQIAAYFGWLAATGAVRVRYRGWAPEAGGPAVIVANHPGLLDAFYVLARVPRAFCIFKPAIGRNPLLAAAARRAGYLPSDRGAELVWDATERLARGASLVVFPEGTRTPPGERLGVLRGGFALIARRAEVPVQLLRIAVTPPLFAKGQRWWRLPPLPVEVVVESGPRLEPRDFASTAALVAEVEAWLRDGGAPRAELTRPAARPLTVA